MNNFWTLKFVLFAYPRFILLCAGLRFPKTLFLFVYFSSLFRVKINVCKLRSYIYFFWTYLLTSKTFWFTGKNIMRLVICCWLVVRRSSNKGRCWFVKNRTRRKVFGTFSGHLIWNFESAIIYSVSFNSNLLIHIFFLSLWLVVWANWSLWFPTCFQRASSCVKWKKGFCFYL